MNIYIVAELYQLISRGIENINSRKRSVALRKQGFNSLSKDGFKKVAFDTRRIDQETDFISRRGLQNYNRSEQFITQATANKIIILSKLHDIVNGLKDKYGTTPEWQDSKTRVLLNTLNSGLRIGINDGDYTATQPGVGNLEYIEELLDMRYRLRLENIDKMAEGDIRGIILSKDEELSRVGNNKTIEITNKDIATKSYDSLMEQLFGGVKASENNKSVERTITITIKDSILDDEKKKE